MNERYLPQVLKNAVFRELQQAELDPLAFKWSVVKGPWAFMQVSKLTHEPTKSFFLFDVGQYDEDYHPQCWPASVPNGFHVSGETNLLYVVRSWIEALAPQLKEPDLWRLAEEQGSFNTNPESSNAPFSPQEQAQIGESLRELEAYVYDAEPTLPEPKRKAVAARFRYFKTATERLGRLDWLSMFVGQLFGMVTERLITVQTFHGLHNLAVALFQRLIQSGSALVNLFGN